MSEKKEERRWHFFINCIKRPFLYCWKYLSDTILWAVFIFFGGLLGVVINLIQRCLFEDLSWSQAIYIDSSCGNFYTYALVLICATLGPLFISLSGNELPHFRKIKIYLTTICLFGMLLCAIFYSMQSKKWLNFEQISNCEYSVDWWQLAFFVFSILVSLYALGVQFIDRDKDENSDLESFCHSKSLGDLQKSNPTATDDEVTYIFFRKFL